jgi:hypothetical protein
MPMRCTTPAACRTTAAGSCRCRRPTPTLAHLQAQLATTLALLDQAGDSDDALYFFRLALLHEDMHHEAALYMAQGLGLALDDPRWQPVACRRHRRC